MNSFHIGPQDLGRKRNYEFNGIKYVAEAHDPFGLITLICLKTKEQIDGQFTAFADAEKFALKHSLKLTEKKAV